MCIILRTKSGNKLGVRPVHPLILILTKFGVWGGLLGMFHKFEFQYDWSINVGAVGVKSCLFPLTRLIAYTSAWKYS